jgi:hypothetical protein
MMLLSSSPVGLREVLSKAEMISEKWEENGRRWSSVTNTNDFLLPLAGRRYRMAFHSWDNWEACPDVAMTIDQTVVDRLFAVTR